MQKNYEKCRGNNSHQNEPALSYTTTPSILYQALQAIWPKQLEEDDLELLDVSLYHLFYNLNLLLQEILPQLAEISAQAEATPQHLHALRILKHQLWLWLSEMKHRLERIEPLCQIITITITHLFTSIDSNEPNTLQRIHNQELFYRTLTSEQHRRALTPQEQHYYVTCLHSWQELNTHTQKIQTFKHLFMDVEDQNLLIQMDVALTRLYQSAQTIFLPLLQQNNSRSSELLLLLLDMQQHTDQLQIQIDMLLTPLYKLRKQTALLVELK